MKQTAVEWFAEKDTELTIQFLEGKLNQIQLAIEKLKCLQQAKEMEREQIEFAYADGFANGFDDGKYDDEPNYIDNEDYYNKTFKSE